MTRMITILLMIMTIVQRGVINAICGNDNNDNNYNNSDDHKI